MFLLRLIGVILLGYLSYLAYEKGAELRAMGTNADGDGIGVSFLGFQVDERVPEAKIPQYATGFFRFSILLAGIGILLLVLPLIKKWIPNSVSKWVQRKFQA